MRKAMKKALSLVLAAAVTLAGVQSVRAATPSPATSVKPQRQESVQSNTTSTGIKVTVDTKKDGTAATTTIKQTKKTEVKLTSTVTVNGVKYKVTTISANTFSKCTNAKKVTLPSTITKIGAKAFSGVSKKLKTIVLDVKKAPTISKTAFKGVDTRKMTIKVSADMSKKQLEKLKKALKKAGFKGKVQKLKK